MTTPEEKRITDAEIVSYSLKEITNHNAVGMCSQRICDKDETQFMVIKLFGMDLHIVLCDKHAEVIGEAMFDKFVRKRRRRRSIKK